MLGSKPITESNDAARMDGRSRPFNVGDGEAVRVASAFCVSLAFGLAPAPLTVPLRGGYGDDARHTLRGTFSFSQQLGVESFHASCACACACVARGGDPCVISSRCKPNSRGEARVTPAREFVLYEVVRDKRETRVEKEGELGEVEEGM